MNNHCGSQDTEENSLRITVEACVCKVHTHIHAHTVFEQAEDRQMTTTFNAKQTSHLYNGNIQFLEIVSVNLINELLCCVL